MEHYAGIDVSLELSSVCVVDATVRIAPSGSAPVVDHLGIVATAQQPAHAAMARSSVQEHIETRRRVR